MYPVLLKFGKFSIYTYGFFVAMGFLVGISLARREAMRLDENPEKIMDLCFYVLVSAIVASRLFYVAVTPEFFMDNPLEIFKIWNGGLVFYGGFIGALITSIIYLKKQRMPLWKTADMVAPSMAIGHFLGRIGCFFAGCCYGKACDLPWAVTFSHPESLAPTGIPLHPTQLYSALDNLGIFLFLWFFRKHKQFEGQVFWLYVLVYGIARSAIEMLRGDDRGSFLFGVISISQAVGAGMSLIAVFMMIFLSRRKGA